jgi:hypothetical protein
MSVLVKKNSQRSDNFILLNYNLIYSHRGDKTERVNSLPEQTFWFEDWPSMATNRPIENAGCLGMGRVMVSLANIWSTDDIVGLSAGSSCTQSSPMWMHLSTSVATLDFSSIGSINSRPWPSDHSFHAWKVQRLPELR